MSSPSSVTTPPGQHDVLLVEDIAALARTYQGFLRHEPYAVRHVETGADALRAVTERVPAAILLDLKLPDMDGLSILEKIKSDGVSSPVIVITAHGSTNTAIAAMRAGASDFLIKPFSGERLKVTLENVLEKTQLSRIVETYKEQIDRRTFEGFIGSSLPMQAVYRIIESAAASDATVFVTGESGTGKELCAQAVHNLSRRRGGPFIAINCAAIPRELMESEIFGHVKGAFTGAQAERSGAASMADGGTLFLDEIGEMDPQLQSKLLRFVQTATFTKVGGSRPEKVDVRFVCATNRDPAAEVEAGRFREDLYYRLHVVPVHLPPLRERDDDILDIARELLGEFARQEGKRLADFAPETEAIFRAYPWPGNVRELQNTIRNIVVLNDGETVTPDMLPGSLTGAASGPGPASGRPPPATAATAGSAANDLGRLADLIRPLDQVERESIERAIELCDGNVRKAAVFLGVGPATIYRKLKAWRG